MAEKLFESGDKNGKLLASLVADPYCHTVITAVFSASGSVLTTPSDILSEFKQHYSTLYVQTRTISPSTLSTELAKISLATLSSEGREGLVAPLSPLEIETAIYSFPNNKTPGPGGLPGSGTKKTPLC